MNRRKWLLNLLATAALPASRHAAPATQAAGNALKQAISALEARAGGRLGAVVMDEKGVITNHRGDERFALCSTFKLVLSATILGRVDRGRERLARRIPVTSSDILSHSPVTAPAVGGTLSVGELCRAAVVTSDNAAANLLLRTCGGPAGVTAFLRSIGDGVTRLDRFEPELNRVDIARGDVRDTTTAGAMAATLLRLGAGNALSPASRRLAVGWLRESTTGLARLRAGLPAEWNAGDKTGTGPDGPTNDIAIAWPPGRPPLVIAAYFDRTGHAAEDNSAVLAAVGRLVADYARAG